MSKPGMTNIELDAIRARISRYRPPKSTAEDLDALIGEVDRLRQRADEDNLSSIRICVGLGYTLASEQATRLLAHVEWQDGVIHDMCLDAGGGEAHRQGAAEELAIILDILREEDNQSPHVRAITRRMIERRRGGTELLPPALARLVLEAERAKVIMLRAACKRIAKSESGYAPAAVLQSIARKALEDSADA